MSNNEKIWKCKIGEIDSVRDGADLPMREIVEAGFFALTGEYPQFIFSGWGAELTEGERACFEDRESDPGKMSSTMTLEQEMELRAEVKRLRAWVRGGHDESDRVIRDAMEGL